MIDLEYYARIKNNYCIGYFGTSDEHLIQLKLLRPVLERHFPGLTLFLGCKDDSYHYLQNCDNVMKLSDIKKRKGEFAHIKELRFDGREHVIQQFLEECEVIDYAVPVNMQDSPTSLCNIVSEGLYPTKNLIKQQIETLKRVVRDRGYDIIMDGPIHNSGLVVGVESVKLYEAAANGIQTILVPTGLGERLYKSMFPNAEVLNL